MNTIRRTAVVALAVLVCLVAIASAAGAKAKPVIDKPLKSACLDTSLYAIDGVNPVTDARVLAITSRAFRKSKNPTAHKFAPRFLTQGAKLEAAVLDAHDWCKNTLGLADSEYAGRL